MEAKKKPRNPSFEQALSELETIVARFEEGALELEVALKLFERGVELANACGSQLGKAEARVLAVRKRLATLTPAEDEE